MASIDIFKNTLMFLSVVICLVSIAAKSLEERSIEDYRKILRQQAQRNYGGYRWKYKTVERQQCKEDAVMYDFLDSMPSSTRCEKCWCHEDGQKHCKSVNSCASESSVRCVDSVYDPQTCCEICPNGPNCLADDRIIPADETVVIQDEFCTRTCECPPGVAYDQKGKKTQAMCFFSCRDQ